MIAPAIPEHESSRLADLLELSLLDTPPEARFDRIVSIASHIFDTPIAYIALVDSSRQWFKSSCGLNFSSTTRESSFCGHTILQDVALIIPDAHVDERFRDNPLVLEPPFVRFYAGHPLRGRRGHNVGTLCLAAPEPRELTGERLALFAEVAALAEHELNMMDLVETQRRLLTTKDQLLSTQAQLATELTEAADYVRGLLPAPITSGPLTVDWRFAASSQLGGDLFDYRWLDDRRLAIYLLDVCGHGVGASLLSVSVRNQLRGSALGANPYDPGAVLTALNDAFPMEEHGLKYFTIWYGVYDAPTRKLHYASAGHPPAVRLRGDQTTGLGSPSLPIGAWSGTRYANHVEQMAAGDRLYVFSDGAYEVTREAGGEMGREEFSALLREAAAAPLAPPTLISGPAASADAQPGCRACLDEVLERVRTIQGAPDFADDCSLMEFRFG